MDFLYREVFLPPGKVRVFQVLLPEALRKEVLKGLHDHHGNQGIERTMILVRERCFWPNLQHNVEQWCIKCERCVVATALRPKDQTTMVHFMGSRPLEILAINFTLLEQASNGCENVLVITDVFSKFTQAYPTRGQKASTVARILRERWFYVYGVPKRIHSDQGRNFEGELLKDCISYMGLRRVGLQHIIRWEMGSAKGLIVLCTIYCVPCPLKRKGHGLSAYYSYFSHITPLPISLLAILPTSLCLAKSLLPVDALLGMDGRERQ